VNFTTENTENHGSKPEVGGEPRLVDWQEPINGLQLDDHLPSATGHSRRAAPHGIVCVTGGEWTVGTGDPEGSPSATA
jgi:hypothetical protein